MIDATHLIELAKAYSAAVQISNKRWVVAASVSLVAISYQPVKDVQVVFGTSFSPDIFPLVLILAISATVLAYANSHLQSTRKKEIFDELIEDGDYDFAVPPNFIRKRDLAHAMVSESSFDQIYQLTSPIRKREARLATYRWIKTFIDTVYIFFPTLAIIVTLAKADFSWPYLLISITAALISLIASTVLYFAIIRYIWTRNI